MKDGLSEIQKRKSNPFRKFLWGLLISGLLALAIWILLGTFFYYSKGFREGYVYKFSHKGVVFKTWEGVLKTGFVTFNNTATPNEEWLFSVSEDSVINALNETDQRTYMKLFYKEHFVKLFWRGETKYMVYKVEVLKN